MMTGLSSWVSVGLTVTVAGHLKIIVVGVSVLSAMWWAVGARTVIVVRQESQGYLGVDRVLVVGVGA